MAFMRKRFLVAALALGALVLSGWPRTEVVVPQWAISVATPDGTPVAGVPVLEFWQHQTMEREPHRERRQTDERGVVVFPNREIRGSTLRRLLVGLYALVRSMHEVGFGPHGHVLIGVQGTTNGCENLVYAPSPGGAHPLRSSCIVNVPFEVIVSACREIRTLRGQATRRSQSRLRYAGRCAPSVAAFFAAGLVIRPPPPRSALPTLAQACSG